MGATPVADNPAAVGDGTPRPHKARLVGANNVIIANTRYAVIIGRAANNVRTARDIVTLRHVARCSDEVRSELAPVIENLREDLDPTMSKSQAAQVIGVSVPTLDKWIARGLLSVQRAESGRPRVMRDLVLALAGQVDDLRRAGQDRHLIATVVDRMQRDDEDYQRDFAELYGPGLVALAESDLVSAAPGPDWHPED